jgi:methionyl aminopeptidase
MTMTIEHEDDLVALARVGRAVAAARDAMLALVAPGVTTADLDAAGAEVLRAHGARPAPPLAAGFPAATCVSVNDEAAHGIPSAARRLRAGDLVNVDVSAEMGGYWADTGASAPVGAVAPVARRLLDAARLANRDGIDAARAGRPLRHIGRAVEKRARRHGFTVIANLCGHGTGRNLWERPSVPGVDDGRDRTILWEGLVLAVEPFLADGGRSADEGPDGWTLFTDNGGLSAQFEHTIVVTHGAPLVLTGSAS